MKERILELRQYVQFDFYEDSDEIFEILFDNAIE